MLTPIPKRIIQTGKQVQQPLRNRAMMSNIQLLNPDYEYLFFDNAGVEAFIALEFPQYRAVFDSFQFPIQRYDFFRYLAVYHYGGFYFDLDVVLASGLSGLLACGCVFPFEGFGLSKFMRNYYQMDWQIGNYAFGAAPGHPFIQAIIENCVKGQKDRAWVKPMMRGCPFLLRDDYCVLNSTGPGLISRTLAENAELGNMVTVLFPDDVCDFRNWNQFGDLGIHLMDGSWRARRGFFLAKLAQHWELWRQRVLLKQSIKLGRARHHVSKAGRIVTRSQMTSKSNEEPLVSILIPAFNAEEWIAHTLRSAIAQTWQRKEIIVVDDGSTDQTVAIARQFESDTVRVFASEGQGAAKTRNKALSLCRGDFIQWLDADDLLAPQKIAKQVDSMRQRGSERTLLVSAWGRFMYRNRYAKFTPTALWSDLSPLEWLLRKMAQNIYMPTVTWLVSRELTEAAGPWDTRLLGDDDGEYFCRVLLASDGVQFVPEAKAYYRGPSIALGGLSHVGRSSARVDALWLSMKLHIGYLRSLEDSERVRDACLKYIQTALIYFYPENDDIVKQAEQIARELGRQIEVPELSWKYSWIRVAFGWRLAKTSQLFLSSAKWSLVRLWEKALFRMEDRLLGDRLRG